MNATRLRFKYALRQCKLIEETVSADSSHCKIKINIDFWKDVRKNKNNSVPLEDKVDNYFEEENIANIWKSHFPNY